MTASNWTPLRRAMAACRSAGVAVPIWWRDDDATKVTPQLESLVKLAERLEFPVHLAIVPAHLDPYLPAECAGLPVIPVVHGWAHVNHGGPGEKRNEFMNSRVTATQETAKSLVHMRSMFGAALRPMFVPPWNRISAEVVNALPHQGYQVISTYGPRRKAEAASGLLQINTHVDPISWRGTRDLIDSEILIAGAAGHLVARSQGAQDATEPFGLLTHHLVHTPAIRSFAEEFLAEMLACGAVPWAMKEKT